MSLTQTEETIQTSNEITQCAAHVLHLFRNGNMTEAEAHKIAEEWVWNANNAPGW